MFHKLKLILLKWLLNSTKMAKETDTKDSISTLIKNKILPIIPKVYTIPTLTKVEGELTRIRYKIIFSSGQFIDIGIEYSIDDLSFSFQETNIRDLDFLAQLSSILINNLKLHYFEIKGYFQAKT